MKQKKTKKPKEKIPFKQKLKNGWKWTREHLLNKETLFFTLIGELIFWSPVIVCGILGLVIDKRFWAVAGSIAAFWTLPLTPGWAIQIGLIFGLKALFHKAFKRRAIYRKQKKGKLNNGLDGTCITDKCACKTYGTPATNQDEECRQQANQEPQQQSNSDTKESQ